MNERSAKDKAMASYLKTHKVERRTGRCPLNPKHAFPVDGIMSHLRTCKGTQPDRDALVAKLNRRRG